MISRDLVFNRSLHTLYIVLEENKSDGFHITWLQNDRDPNRIMHFKNFNVSLNYICRRISHLLMNIYVEEYLTFLLIWYRNYIVCNLFLNVFNIYLTWLLADADSGGGAPGARPPPPKKKRKKKREREREREERGEKRGSKEETIRSIRGKTSAEAFVISF